MNRSQSHKEAPEALATCAPLHWRIHTGTLGSRATTYYTWDSPHHFSLYSIQARIFQDMPQSIAFSVLLIACLSTLSFSIGDNFWCYTDVPPYTRRPTLAPFACEPLIWKVLAEDFAQEVETYGRVTAPDIIQLPLAWYGTGLPTPTNCVMEMDTRIGGQATFKLLDKGVSLTRLEKKCIWGDQGRGGAVTLAPDRVVRLMLYALPIDDYERMLRTKPGEIVINSTGGGLLSGPGLGQGTMGHDSVS